MVKKSVRFIALGLYAACCVACSGHPDYNFSSSTEASGRYPKS